MSEQDSRSQKPPTGDVPIYTVPDAPKTAPNSQAGLAAHRGSQIKQTRPSPKPGQPGSRFNPRVVERQGSRNTGKVIEHGDKKETTREAIVRGAKRGLVEGLTRQPPPKRELSKDPEPEITEVPEDLKPERAEPQAAEEPVIESAPEAIKNPEQARRDLEVTASMVFGKKGQGLGKAKAAVRLTQPKQSTMVPLPESENQTPSSAQQQTQKGEPKRVLLNDFEAENPSDAELEKDDGGFDR